MFILYITSFVKDVVASVKIDMSSWPKVSCGSFVWNFVFLLRKESDCNFQNGIEVDHIMF
jgi:hypothetical protein